MEKLLQKNVIIKSLLGKNYVNIRSISLIVVINFNINVN